MNTIRQLALARTVDWSLGARTVRCRESLFAQTKTSL